MASELVERLRATAPIASSSFDDVRLPRPQRLLSGAIAKIAIEAADTLEAQASRIAELEAWLRGAARDMTCRNGGAHYCPNCDTSSFDARASIRALLGDREG